MSFLAVIPARSGSKRVPGKNTKLLDGIPLIAHTIKAAQNAGLCDIMVSTDCESIAKIAQDYDAQVPWLRSASLAEDKSEVIDAVQEILEAYQKIDRHFDSVLLLQPTSPFRKAETIRKALELHNKSGLSVVSVSPYSLKPSWFKALDENNNLIPAPVFKNVDLNKSEHNIYLLNGAIYIASVEQIRANHSFYSENTQALVMENPDECIDIDTMHDWSLAERVVESKKI